MRDLIILAMTAVFSVAGVGARAEAPQGVAVETSAIAVERAFALFRSGAVFIDVRRAVDFDAGRIPGARHVELKWALTEPNLRAIAPKRAPVVFYCNGPRCGRAREAAGKARGHAADRVVKWTPPVGPAFCGS